MKTYGHQRPRKTAEGRVVSGYNSKITAPTAGFSFGLRKSGKVDKITG